MQAQACLLLQKTLSARELRVCFEDPEWEQLISQLLGKATQTLQTLGEAQNKGEHQRELSILELLNTLFRTVNHEVSQLPKNQCPRWSGQHIRVLTVVLLGRLPDVCGLGATWRSQGEESGLLKDEMVLDLVDCEGGCVTVCQKEN